MYQGGTVFSGLESGQHPNLAPQVMRYPEIPERDFLRPTRFVDILRDQPDRYLTYALPAANFDKGYLFTQRPQDWPALALERGTLFQIPDVLGYNPVQLPRYWTYIRSTNDNPVFYNASVIGRPDARERAPDGRSLRHRAARAPGAAGRSHRRERRRLRPRSGLRVGAPRVGPPDVDGRGLGPRRPRGDRDPRVRSVAVARPGTGARDRADAGSAAGDGDVSRGVAGRRTGRGRHAGAVGRRGPQQLRPRLDGHARRATRSPSSPRTTCFKGSPCRRGGTRSASRTTTRTSRADSRPARAVWLILLAAIPAAALLERRRSAQRPGAVAP